jgi:hypothetical protein
VEVNALREREWHNIETFLSFLISNRTTFSSIFRANVPCLLNLFSLLCKPDTYAPAEPASTRPKCRTPYLPLFFIVIFQSFSSSRNRNLFFSFALILPNCYLCNTALHLQTYKVTIHQTRHLWLLVVKYLKQMVIILT